MHPSTTTFISWAKSTTPTSLEFLNWCLSHPDIKVTTTPIPPGILPPSLSTPKLHDVKVDPGRSKKGRRTDDEIYKFNDEIRRRVPRGVSVFEFYVGGEDGSGERVVCVPVYALRKFTGGFGDDDADETIPDSDVQYSTNSASDSDSLDTLSNIIWRRFFVSPPECASRVYVTDKANGAAAHLSILRVGPIHEVDNSEDTQNRQNVGNAELSELDEYVIIGGSKNVHLMFRTPDDFIKYGDVSRFNVAFKVSRAIYDSLVTSPTAPTATPTETTTGTTTTTITTNKIPNTIKFFEYLWTHKLTACFELLDVDDMHVEDLRPLISANAGDGATLSLSLYAMVSYQKCFGEKYLCESMDVCFRVAEECGVGTVGYRVVELEGGEKSDISEDGEMKVCVDEIRRGYGHEGAVLYFVDEENCVIGLLKKKTVWYIIIRAFREKLKPYSRFLRPEVDLENEQTKQELVTFDNKRRKLIHGRLISIQKWLDLTNEQVQAWKSLGDAATKWMKEQVEFEFKKEEKTLERELGQRFPVLWKRFLEETGNSDRL